jgi:hypothetical protein
MSKAIPVILLALALAACGKKDMLKPAENQVLPPKPETAMVQPTPADLLTPTSQARPLRFDEIVTKSQELQSDRFDMPPPH